MKTANFTSDAEVVSLVEAFETATIAAVEFTHVAHIAVALSYLNTLSPDEALARMREKIRAFAAHHGVDNLYHETLTTFWMKLLNHVATNADGDRVLFERINSIIARWGTSAPVKAHYTHELISSQAAREKWIPPDRLPLAFDFQREPKLR